MSGLAAAQHDKWERRLERVRTATVHTVKGPIPRRIVDLFRDYALIPLPQYAEWSKTGEQIERHLGLFVRPFDYHVKTNQSGFMVVAWDGERPIGFALVARIGQDLDGSQYFEADTLDETADVQGAFVQLGFPSFGYVDTVVVDDEFQGHGIGKKLVQHSARQFLLEGINHFVVRCPTKNYDTFARLFLGAGFEVNHRYALREEYFLSRNIHDWNLSPT